MNQSANGGILSWLGRFVEGRPEALAPAEQWSESLVVLEIPSLPASLHYRAYAERVGDSTMLQWAVQRLRRTTYWSDLVILINSSEARHVEHAVEEQSDLSVLLSSEQGQLHDLRALLRSRDKKRLLVVNITAGLLPPDLIQGLMREHLARKHRATILTDHPCSVRPVLVEADLLVTMARGIPGLPKNVLPKDLRMAIDTLARLAQRRGKSNWLHVATIPALKPEEQTLRRWPYRVFLQEPDDVVILRKILRKGTDPGEEPSSVEPLDKWTDASSEYRAERLADLRGGAGPRSDYSRDQPCVLTVQVPSAFSGGEEVAVLLAERIVQRPGFDCAALVGFPGIFTERLTHAGVNVRIALRDFARSSVENYLYCRRELDAVKPTLVHAHGITGTQFCCAVAERGIPFLQHVHVASEAALSNLSEQILFASTVIAVSEFVKGQLIRLGTDPTKIRVIYNGVMTATATAPDPQLRYRTRQAIGVPQGAPVVLVAARLVTYKRHDIALESFAILRSQLPNAHLVLVGEASPGESALEGIEDLISRLRIRDCVRLLGFWRDMPSLYAASDVVLLPSENEPLGLAILEGMAAGVPVIGARSGGIPEMIVPRVSGLLVEPGDIAAFAGAMRDVLAESDLRIRLVEGGLTRVLQQFSVSRFVDEMLNLYEELLPDASVRRRPPMSPDGDLP